MTVSGEMKPSPHWSAVFGWTSSILQLAGHHRFRAAVGVGGRQEPECQSAARMNHRSEHAEGEDNGE